MKIFLADTVSSTSSSKHFIINMSSESSPGNNIVNGDNYIHEIIIFRADLEHCDAVMAKFLTKKLND